MPDGSIGDIALADYRDAWTTLFFWPMDFTFVCPTEIRGYNELAAEFGKLDCKLLGASIDSVYVHRAWVANGLGKISFPMIGDVGRSLTAACGILNPQGVALRATFIINPDGTIESASVNALNVGRSAAETLRLVAAFQSGELTACEWRPGQKFINAG